MTAEADNATTFAHKNLYQAVEYLTVCHDYTFLDVIGVISEMMSEIASVKESSHIIRIKAVQ